MNQTLIFIFVGVIGVAVGIYFGKKRTAPNTEQIELKEENLRKIMEFAPSEEKFTNSDVEKLLGVSDATATRYLEALEREGKLEQIGTTGQSVEYRVRI